MNDKTPSIRFKGFTDDWEQRKVKEICSISTGKSNTQDRVDEGIYPFYVRSPIVERSNRYLFDEEAVLTVGDGVGTGKVFHYVNGKYDLHQRVYRMFDFSSEINAKYFYYYFSDHFYNRVMSMTAKTSVDSVRYEMIADMDILLPKLNEQIAISNCFDNLDNLITLHQRKYDQLLNIKKSMLEKMFPKNGKKAPEIRFDGFTDDWEQRKFGDGMDLLTGFPFESEKFSDNGINLIRGMNVKRGYLDLSDSLCMKWKSSEGLEKYLLENEDILIQMDGALIGKSYAKIKERQLPALLVQRVTRARAIPEVSNSDFMYQTIQRDFLKYIILNKTDSAVPHLSLNDIREFPIRVPNLEEQKKIGEYLSNLDNLITLHQRKLEKLQNLKKSLLKQMLL